MVLHKWMKTKNTCLLYMYIFLEYMKTNVIFEYQTNYATLFPLYNLLCIYIYIYILIVTF